MLRVAPADFEPQRLFMRSMYLLVMGLLLGYLAEQQKQLRAEKAVVARVLGKARVEAGRNSQHWQMVLQKQAASPGEKSQVKREALYPQKANRGRGRSHGLPQSPTIGSSGQNEDQEQEKRIRLAGREH